MTLDISFLVCFS